MNGFNLWFQNPEMLWLGVLLAPLAIWDGMRRWPSSLGRQVAGVAARLTLLAALILAVSSPVLVREAPARDVIFMVDTSASVTDDAIKDASRRILEMKGTLDRDSRAGVLVFDKEARIVIAPGEDWTKDAVAPGALRQGEGGSQTDLASAVELGLGMIRHGAAGELVLFSDGRTTGADLERQLASARARGVKISTRVLATVRSSARLGELSLDDAAPRPGETLRGKVILEGGSKEEVGMVIAMLGDEKILEVAAKIPRSERLEIPFEHALDPKMEAGATQLEVVFVPKGEKREDVRDSLRSSARVMIQDAPRVLLVTNDLPEVEPLARTLEAEGMLPEIVKVAKLYEEDAPKLDDVDLVVLGNVPATLAGLDLSKPVTPLPASFIQSLRGYVSAGGGLIVLGGDRSYDLGGYGKTEFRKFLPVVLEPEDTEIYQPVTMIIILDRSGSMGEWVLGGETKMSLANKGAVAAMKLLRPFDKIGVMSVDEKVHWKVPVQDAVIDSGMERSVRSIRADGGGIFVYTSMVAAWDALKKVNTPLKHVILFSDTADAEEQVKGIMFGWGSGPNSYDLARGMVKDGITTSVIGVGSVHDSDTRFLRNLARHGKGRFHITSNARKLSALFVEETQQLLQMRIKEKNFRPVSRGKHPSLEGVDLGSAPSLRGYVELEAKPTADVPLVGPEEHPIMISWQYGLGQVVTMATDAGSRWSGKWVEWDGYATFWTQMARWSLKRQEGAETGAQVTFDKAIAKIAIDRRTTSGKVKDEVGLRAMLKPEGGIWRPIELDASEPGFWTTDLELEPNGAYTLGVVDEKGAPVLTQSFATPPSIELRHGSPDGVLMARIAERTGGQREIESIGQAGEGKAPEEIPLWLYLVVFAAALFPLDALIRRPAREA